ncbi:MAG: LysR substrate-binding domain-containing protein [Rhodospirillales bacterium]
MLTIRQIEVFRAVMKVGSTSAAAEGLGLSQPSVSQHIAKLEEVLGLLLFYRDRGHLIPTPDAFTLLAEAENAHASVERLVHTAHGLQQSGRGVLRIATPVPFAQTLVPQAIKKFIKGREEVSFSFMADNPDRCRELVAHHHADIGISNWLVEHPGCDVTPLADSPIVCILPENHPLCRKKRITPRDLADEPLIIVCRLASSRMRWEHVFRVAGVVPNIRIEVQSSADACTLVGAGVGISLVAKCFAQHYKTFRIALRPFEPVLKRTFVILTTQNKLISSLVSAFVSVLRDTVGKKA